MVFQNGSKEPGKSIEAAFADFVEAWLSDKRLDTAGFCKKYPKYDPELRKKIDEFIMKWERSEIFQLLSRWSHGDKEALNALLERHLSWIHQKVRKRLTPIHRRRGDETCDYVQDVVVRFLKNAPSFVVSDVGHFRALLVRIVENSLNDKYDWFTARRREIARDRPLPSDTVLYLDAPKSSVRTPSRSAEHHENEAWVRLGMEFLSPEDRELLILRQWKGQSFVEIGDHLRISPDAARMRHNQAVARLERRIWDLRQGKLSRMFE